MAQNKGWIVRNTSLYIYRRNVLKANQQPLHVIKETSWSFSESTSHELENRNICLNIGIYDHSQHFIHLPNSPTIVSSQSNYYRTSSGRQCVFFDLYLRDLLPFCLVEKCFNQEVYCDEREEGLCTKMHTHGSSAPWRSSVKITFMWMLISKTSFFTISWEESDKKN